MEGWKDTHQGRGGQSRRAGRAHTREGQVGTHLGVRRAHARGIMRAQYKVLESTHQ